MAGYNRVVLLGNLARDPELRYTPQGTAVADLRLAVTTKFKQKEETLFIDVTMWDRKAEVCCEYLSKGRPLLVEGRLQEDTWEDRETGQKRSKMRVVCDNFQFVGGGEGRGGGGGGGGGRSSRGGGGGGGGGGSRGGSGGGAPLEEDFGEGEDIPF